MTNTLRRKIKQNTRPYLYSGLSLILIFLIVVFPILYTLYISFTNMSLYHYYEFDFIGFANYTRALFNFDSGFLVSLLITLLWTLVNMVIQLLIAYFTAILLNSKNLKFGKFYKTLLMIPWAIPGYVSILLWKTGMFNYNFGLINKWFSALSIELNDLLSNSVSAFICCTVVNLWLALPYMIMIIDGALQSIDKSFYEEAEIEGCGKIRKHLSITVPLIKPIIGPAVLITTFTTFKQFDIIYLMTMTPVNTGSDVSTIITYAYENAFITSNYGYSSAVSIIIFVLLIFFSALTNSDLRRKNKYGTN